ncbi:MAG: HpcH/HpaI aldolase/citrate lyase family protein [Mycobacteriaceae bacterium]
MESFTPTHSLPTISPDLARSWLLVSGSQVHGFESAINSSADAVIVDLEDGVAESQKSLARSQVSQWLGSGSSTVGRVWVRINAIDTRHWAEDIRALAPLNALAGVVLPKTESPESLASTAKLFSSRVGLIALVESALGVENVGSIAKFPGLTRIAFGTNDFCKDINVQKNDQALHYPRSRLVIASRAHRLPSPIDGPCGVEAAQDVVITSALHSKAHGLGAQLCLLESHVDAINKTLSPSAVEVSAAEALLGSNADTLGGSYRPKLIQAQRTLELHTIYSHASSGTLPTN